MEDSFRVRVEKVFGSLEAPSSSSSLITPPSSSLWCLTDEEIERKEWNRDKGSPYDDHDDHVPKSKPYPSNLDAFFANQPSQIPSSSLNKPPDFRQVPESDLQDLDDSVSGDGEDEFEDEEENIEKQKQPLASSRQLVKPDDHNDEEWDIRSSIGLDCTLDYEEEEDAYDKVAICREEAGDRSYVRDITDYDTDIDSNSELPSTFRDVTRDPRANHMAAKIRLKEDAEAAGDFNFSQFSSVITQNNKLEDGVDLKSSLKSKENQMAEKSEKHVRFESGCKDDNEGGLEMEKSPASDAASFQPRDSSSVPDYIRNPSKFTHYTFDSSIDDDEQSNQKAYMDFFNLLRGSNTMETEDGVCTDPLRSVIFTPKKKPGDGSMKIENDKESREDGCKVYMHKEGLPLGIAAGTAQESEVCAMEEDEPEIAVDRSSSLRKAGRRYRTKGSANLEELDY